ncbi:hypothetical protein TWF718_005451 [Orbilia javanica]|uniref:F-box domain-containing protein n=1 Tax=Orbilia javanica TaxID=47235 RepID=A0AAN8MS01_9PEZI
MRQFETPKMATIKTVPPEIHLEIAQYLLPCDIAALSLTCQVLREHLGRSNQFFWYNCIRRGISPKFGRTKVPVPHPDGLDTEEEEGTVTFEQYYKEFQPEEKNYWLEARRIISGGSRYGCCACLAHVPVGECTAYSYFVYPPGGTTSHTSSRFLAVRRYCPECFWEWHIQTDVFQLAYPDAPLQGDIGYEMPSTPSGGCDAQGIIAKYLRQLITIPAVTKSFENSYSTTFAIAGSPPAQFKAKWTRARGGDEAQILDETLNFLKEIYQRKYKNLHIVLSPDAYYKALADSLLFHVLVESNYDKIHTVVGIPPGRRYDVPVLSVTEDVMEISRSLGREQRGDIEAVSLANSLHIRLFGDPGNFRPAALDPAYRGFIKERMSCCFSGQVMQPVGALSWYNLYDYLYFKSPGLRNKIRCYWCLRQNNWKDTAENRYVHSARLNEFPENWIAAHVITHHPDLAWKRPKNEVHDTPMVEIMCGDMMMLDWIDDGDDRSFPEVKKMVQQFRNNPPDFVNEELEDIPESVMRPRVGRLSESKYFHWI